jgi:hypothetical protein
MNRPQPFHLYPRRVGGQGGKVTTRREGAVVKRVELREKKTYPMVGFEIVNLLLEEDGPEVFAEEFDDVQVVEEAGTVARESGGVVSNVSPVSHCVTSCVFLSLLVMVREVGLIGLCPIGCMSQSSFAIHGMALLCRNPATRPQSWGKRPQP